MQKNVVVACGLGDIFVYLTRLDDFFKNNPEYESLKFWAWNHSPKIARELLQLDKHSVSLYDVSDMTHYIERSIDKDMLERAKPHFIKQTPNGNGVDSYMKFINMFFYTLESWVHLQTYTKYKSTYPYILKNVKPYEQRRPYFVAHPYSEQVTTESPMRRWPEVRWSGLLKLLSRNYREFDIYIIGKNKDKHKANPFGVGRGFINIHDLRGKTTFTEAVSYVYGAKAVLGINSWPTIMSSWAGIPTYSQWFVQNQLLHTHTPPTMSKHFYIEKHKNYPESSSNFYPKADEALVHFRRVFNAATVI